MAGMHTYRMDKGQRGMSELSEEGKRNEVDESYQRVKNTKSVT